MFSKTEDKGDVTEDLQRQEQEERDTGSLAEKGRAERQCQRLVVLCVRKGHVAHFLLRTEIVSDGGS